MTTASGMWPSHPHHMRSPFWKPPVVGGVVWVRVGVGGTAAGAGGSVVLGGNMAGKRQEREEQEREREGEIGVLRHREKCGGVGRREIETMGERAGGYGGGNAGEGDGAQGG